MVVVVRELKVAIIYKRTELLFVSIVCLHTVMVPDVLVRAVLVILRTAIGLAAMLCENLILRGKQLCSQQFL